jgi:hypothetical protein
VNRHAGSFPAEQELFGVTIKAKRFIVASEDNHNLEFGYRRPFF